MARGRQREFKAAIEDAGYILAKGDRRNFCVIDQAASEHSLGRRLGVKAALLRERMADIDQGSLPTVSEARGLAATKAEGGAPAASATPEPEFSNSASTPLDEQQAADFMTEPDTRLEGTELAARFGDNYLPAGLIEDTSDPLAEHRDAATDAIPPDHAEAAPDVSDGLVEDNADPLEGAAVDDASTITSNWTEARAGQFSDERPRFTGWERLAVVVRGYWERFVDLVQDEQSGTGHERTPEATEAATAEALPDAVPAHEPERRGIVSWVRHLLHRDPSPEPGGDPSRPGANGQAPAPDGTDLPGEATAGEEAAADARPAAPVEQPAPAAPLEDWERFHQSAHAAPAPEADAPEGWERFNQSAHATPDADAPEPAPPAPEPEQKGPELD